MAKKRKKPRHNLMMIDIETLNTKRDSAIISMGYLMFSRDKLGEMSKEKLVCIDPFSHEGYGTRSISWSTLKFHLSLPQETHQYLLEGNEVSLMKALTDLSSYIEKHQPQEIWANGICFDITILEDCFEMMEVPIPWKFNQVRDARTIYKEAKITAEHWSGAHEFAKGSLHNPLVDCKVQAYLLQGA